MFKNKTDWERGTPINIEITHALQLENDSQTFNFNLIAAAERGTVVKVDAITVQQFSSSMISILIDVHRSQSVLFSNFDTIFHFPTEQSSQLSQHPFPPFRSF